MENIAIEELAQIPTREHKIEIVERKGIGHPDTICDSIMNQVSINLCEKYLENFGVVMHHNVDKSLLAAGGANIKFGGGSMIKPMKLIFGDRATFSANNVNIPVNEIAIDTAKKWLKENLRFVDPEKDMIYQLEIKPGSEALSDIFKRKGEVLGANDTSASVGYAPFTPTEDIVIKTEKFLNSSKFKEMFPESGEDIKVMGLRKNNSLNITVSMAFVDKFIDNEETYFKRKEEMMQEISSFLQANANFDKIDFYLNTLDERGRGTAGLYLTVLGTCADSADCGQVGRGNRVNGVISLNRPAGSEAAAGKNPVSHVGKIYNLLSFKIAKEIYDNVSGIKEVYVWLLSQIGRKINDPNIAATQVVLENGTSIHTIKPQIQEIMNKEFEKINDFTIALAKGKFAVC